MTPRISPGLLGAYRRARYRVDAVPPFHLRVDMHSAPLAALLTGHGVTSAAFVTAWNPYSVVLADEENARAHARLVAELHQAGLAVVAGFGEWESDPAKGETSVLVLGITEGRARRLGQRYRQHAILFAGPDAIPRLALLSPLLWPER